MKTGSFLLRLMIYGAFLLGGAPSILLAEEGRQVQRENLIKNGSFTWDRDRDERPDYWVRDLETGGGPAYGEWKRSDQVYHSAPASLQLDLNGASVVVRPWSAPQKAQGYPINPHSGYLFTAHILTEGFEGTRCRAMVIITWYDKKDEVIEVNEVVANINDNENQKFEPIRRYFGSVSPNAVRATIHLAVRQGTSVSDPINVAGKAWFDDVSFVQQPRIEVRSPDKHNLLGVSEIDQLVLRVQGLLGGEYTLRYFVQDYLGQDVDQGEYTLRFVSTREVDERALQLNLQGKVGHFKLRVTIVGDSGLEEASDEVVFGVIPDKSVKRGRGGSADRFGVDVATLSPDHPVYPKVPEIVSRLNMRYARLTVWEGQNINADELEVSPLMKLIDRFGRENINLVGVLKEMPPQLRDLLGGHGMFRLFVRDPRLWQEEMQTTGRIFGGVEFWQLGPDGDISFLEEPREMPDILKRVLRHLDIPGSHVGLPLDEMAPTFTAGVGAAMGADFYVYKFPPGLSSRKVDLEGIGKAQSIAILSLPDPLEVGVESQLKIMVDDVLNLKVAGFDSIYFPLIDGRRGLVNELGLFTPAYFTARMINNTLEDVKEMGSFDLESGAVNTIYDTGKELTMVTWHTEQVFDVMYIGKQAQAVDVMGNYLKVDHQGDRNVIVSSRQPRFYVDLDEGMILTRLSMTLDQKQIEPRSGITQQSLTFINHFDKVLSGKLTLSLPEHWEISPTNTFTIDAMRPGESRTIWFGMRPSVLAETGVYQDLKIDMKVDSLNIPSVLIIKRFLFDSGNLEMSLDKYQLPDGRWRVTQKVVNIGRQRLKLASYSSPVGRLEDKRYIGVLPPEDVSVQTYIVTPEDLERGELIIGVKELQGQGRFLNKPFSKTLNEVSDGSEDR